MGDPGPCPACETVALERRGGKDMCPRCYYIQPCCDGGQSSGKTLDYEYFIKKRITKTPDLIIRVENLYSDILKLPFFMDNSCELFDIVYNNILNNGYSSGYDYKEYYDQDLADYVYSYLEEDFVYFNYNKDSWKNGTP